MALIPCKYCGKSVSEKAKVCPNCGGLLMDSEVEEHSVKYCKECGAELLEGSDTCPNCGCPVENCDLSGEEESPQKVESAAVSLPKSLSKLKRGMLRNIVIGVVAVILIIIIAVTVSGNHTKSSYSANLSSASSAMLSGAADAERAGNLIKKVWYNCIYEERDTETDPYTRNDWGFYDDFNDALRKLFQDSTFCVTISNIESNQTMVADLMKELRNPPKEYEDAYAALKDYYDEYLAFTNLVVDPSGSLQTFSNNFNDADSNTLNAYNAMKLYLED